MQFKEDFPDCKKHLAENKKKKTGKLRDKDAAKSNKSKGNAQNKSLKKQKIDSDKNVEQSQHSEDEEACDKLSETRSSSRKRKKTSDEDCTSLEKQKFLEKDSTSEAPAADRQVSVIKPSSVTKEATVKRFAELLEEQEADQDAQIGVESQDPAGTATEQVKVVDDFFITGDDQNYQGNNASTSRSHTRGNTPPRYNTRAKAFQLNDQIKKQNVNRKNEANLSKSHLGKQSFPTKSKKTSAKTKSANKSNANENATNKKDESINLHPSWMAKKKEQEIMSRGFQGKKIVFTDD